MLLRKSGGWELLKLAFLVREDKSYVRLFAYPTKTRISGMDE